MIIERIKEIRYLNTNNEICIEKLNNFATSEKNYNDLKNIKFPNNIDNFKNNKTINIYFEKDVKFPRHKLTLNDKFKRVIKIEKADIVIINDIQPLLKSYTYLHCYIDLNTNNIYHKSYHSLYNNTLKKQPGLNLSEICFKKCIKKINIDFINDNYDKIIQLSDFSNYFDNSLTDITDDVYNEVKTLIESKSNENINLAINVLMNYKLDNKAFELHELFKQYGVWIKSHNLSNSNTFLNVFENINIQRYDLDRSESKSYYINLYKNITNIDQKNKAQLKALSLINRYSSIHNYIKELISIDVDVKKIINDIITEEIDKQRDNNS